MTAGALRATVTSAALQVFLLGASCPAVTGKAPYTIGPLPRTPVASVEIVPPRIHAKPGASFEVSVVARTVLGTPIKEPGPVTWSGDAQFSRTDVLTTFATAPMAGRPTISVAIAGKTASAEIILGQAAADEDDVTLPHNEKGPVAVVLIDANEKSAAVQAPAASAHCQEDLIYRVAGHAALGHNLTSGCTNTLTLFAVGGGVRFESSGLAQDLWTDSPNSVARAPLPELLVELVVWLRVTESFDAEPAGAPAVVAKADANYATDIYRQRRAGMVFSIRDGEGGADGSSRSFTYTDRACAGAEGQLGLTTVQGPVNVAYVEWILHAGDHDIQGVMCDRNDGEPALLIVSWNRSTTSTLAHELAHLMGLKSKAFGDDGSGGHTTHMDTIFDPTNLMWDETSGRLGTDRVHLSLGQVFRMNVDSRSWVNRKRGIDPSTGGELPAIRPGETRECQKERHTSTPCPKLCLDVGVREHCR